MSAEKEKARRARGADGGSNAEGGGLTSPSSVLDLEALEVRLVLDDLDEAL